MSSVHNKLLEVRQEIGKVIVGQERMLDLLLVSMLANGHVLLEGVPGVAKTITAKLLAKTIHVGFSRIQFTPDLMPSDILGTLVFDVKKSDFEYRKGPIFSNIILIDEINRAPAKTQAALFEVIEERQITIDGDTHAMSLPFLVLATQNPIDAYAIAGDRATIVHELRLGRPLVVGLVPPYEGGQLRSHYEVIIAAHPDGRVVTIDPGDAGWRVRSWAGLDAEWAPGGYPTLVVLGPKAR